jgi:hypothetical protein
MMHKRTIYSLLLTSFILVFAFASGFAQTVTFESKNTLRCADGVVDITVDPVVGDIAAFEVVFEVATGVDLAFFDAIGVTWDPALTVLTNRVVDLSGVDGTSPDYIRIAGMMTDPGDACMAGAQVVAQVTFTANRECTGTVDLSGSIFECQNGNVTTQSQVVACADYSSALATVNPGTVTFVNEAPSLVPISDAILPWGSSFVDFAVGQDPDTINGCEKLTYQKIAGPTNLFVSQNSGEITWATTGADICSHEVTVQVTDSCGATAQTSFWIHVTNEPPTITCPADETVILWGWEASGGVVAEDGETPGGPAPLSYSMVSFNGPGSVDVDPLTGDWSWQTLEDNAYIGTFELCIKVTDGAPLCLPYSSNADTCCLTIRVAPTFRVTIEKTHNTFQGQIEDVMISIADVDPANEMGGFDFLVAYDASALSFLSADPGQLLLDCGWEYFTYRFGPDGNCGTACPSGMVRIVAIAESNNGAIHPTCFGPDDAGTYALATMHFMVTNDRTLECQYVPISFYWLDCGDNAISSVSGDTLYIDRKIYGFDTQGMLWDEEDDLNYPESNRLPNVGSPDDPCLVNDPGKPLALRMIDFWNGGIDIVCADSIDARGDINLNNIANEVADAVLFSNYFVYGLDAFNINLQGQIAASDVNADGKVLTVADLVYLIRIVVGDAAPYSKTVAPATPTAVRFTHDKTGVMSVKDGAAIGAAYVVVEGEVAPTLLAQDMEMEYAFDGSNTRVLVWSRDYNSFTGDFLNVNGNVVTIEMATYEGVPVALEVLPTEFALNQNYPNPFNPTTTISAALPVASDYTLTIYNVNGQQVSSFAGSHEAGVIEVEWNASAHASGVYFYKLTAGSFTDVKKMVLLK